MNKSSLFLILGLIVLILSPLPWDAILPPWNTTEVYCKELAGSTRRASVTLHLTWGSIVHGQVFVEGENDDINFLMTDSSGHVYIQPSVIKSGEKIVWRVPHTAAYRWHFSSVHAIDTDQLRRTFSYTFKLYYYTHLFIIVGITLLAHATYFHVKVTRKVST